MIAEYDYNELNYFECSLCNRPAGVCFVIINSRFLDNWMNATRNLPQGQKVNLHTCKEGRRQDRLLMGWNLTDYLNNLSGYIHGWRY